MECSFYKIEDDIYRHLKSKDLKKAIAEYRKLFSPNFDSISSEFKELDFKHSIICFVYTLGYKLCSNTCYRLRSIALKHISSLQNLSDYYELIDAGEGALVEFFEFISERPFICNNSLISNVIDYIEANIESNITLDSLSEKFHISRNYLSSLFIKNTGMKITTFINNLRVQKSKSLLENTDYSLLHISQLCGFKSQNYFSTVFKKLEGITPLNYRIINEATN